MGEAEQIVNFNYNSRGEVKSRKVFRMTENEGYIEGFDIGYLTNDEYDALVKHFKDRPIQEVSGRLSQEDDPNFNKEWLRSWRRFKKSSMVIDEKQHSAESV